MIIYNEILVSYLGKAEIFVFPEALDSQELRGGWLGAAVGSAAGQLVGVVGRHWATSYTWDSRCKGWCGLAGYTRVIQDAGPGKE